MIIDKREISNFLEENDVKFIRLAFCDVFGIQKNISIMPTEIERALTSGIHIDSTAIEGKGTREIKDLYLFPDLTTSALLPWRPQSGRVVRFYCDIKYADGTPYELDCRKILRDKCRSMMTKGYGCTVGAECEFYLFKTDEMNEKTDIPFDNGSYLDAEPRDKGQNVRREICLTLENMGVSPESSMHEQGPGQNEIDFRYSDALTSADNVVTLKSVVETISAQNGLYATFEPKPIKNNIGNGFHINLMPYKIANPEENIHREFIAGILEHAPEMTAFLNPSEQSYLRLGEYNAPSYVSWSRENHGQLILVPNAYRGIRERINMRSPDGNSNPYIAYTLLLAAGLDGIERHMELCPPTDYSVSKAPNRDEFVHLPRTLEDAVELARKSDFIGEILPKSIFDVYAGQ